MKAGAAREKRLRVAERDGACCFYCRKPADPETLTLDHWIPQAVWRCNKSRNLRLACEPCNTAKGNRLPLPVALAVLKLVRENELWWRACMTGSAIEYRVYVERHHERRFRRKPHRWEPRPKCWPLDRAGYASAA